MHTLRTVLAVVIGAMCGYFLLAHSERDTSFFSSVLHALAYVLPGVIAGIIARRHAALSGLLAGLLPYVSYIAPYAAIYHFSAGEVATALIKGLVLYGIPCAIGAWAVAHVHNGTPHSGPSP